MATISSPGIGSGLDVKSIVSQLVAIEKQPLNQLQVRAASVQAKISIFGEMKSLLSTLSSAAGTLNSLTTWTSVSASSSKPESVVASASGGTAAANLTVTVDMLAQAQSFASASVAGGGALGAGTLTLQPGSYGSGPTYSFLAEGDPIEITVGPTDTLANVASKINDLKGNIQATILNDGTGERLLLRSKNTGETAGFQVSVTDTDGDLGDFSGLSRLMSAGTGNDAMVTQYGANAQITVNNSIAVTSSSNVFENVISGLKLTLPDGATVGTTAEVRVSQNQDTIRTALESFVNAYNKLNTYLQEATKYDASTQSAGALQGDSFTIGIQSSLRGILQSATTGGTFARLADIGISQQLGGTLAIDSTKLNAALSNTDELNKFFRQDNGNANTNGLGLKIKSFADGLLNATGLFKTKEDSLQRALSQNSKEQTRVNEKVARIEAQLNRRYSALDAQLAGLTALNNYVAQQVTQWNKSSNN